MRLVRLAGLVLAVSVSLAAGCGGKKTDRSHHGGPAATRAPAPPTPDTTPIEVLRTPAGLVLKIDVSPTPGVSPSPTPKP